MAHGRYSSQDTDRTRNRCALHIAEAIGFVQGLHIAEAIGFVQGLHIAEAIGFVQGLRIAEDIGFVQCLHIAEGIGFVQGSCVPGQRVTRGCISLVR
jgi:hypothetical protein